MLGGDYKLNRCSRECFSQKRPLREGESFYSVVLELDEEYERRDYSAEAWKEPPEGTIGVWKNRMPTANERKLVLAPREVLLELLCKMEEFPDKGKLRYVFALMLLRKKIVQLYDTGEPLDKSVLMVKAAKDSNPIAIDAPPINRSESEELTEELQDLLYCEASELDEEEHTVTE